MRAKVCTSRKNMANVMEGGKFGGLTISRHGISLEVPAEFLFADGRIKKYALEIIDRMFEDKITAQQEMVG